MTATQALGVGAEGEARTDAETHWFDQAMRLPGATAHDDPTGRVDYDGPRCPDCAAPVDDDGPCDDCGDGEPHPYPCPTCGGNGCRACGDTGELVEWVR